MIRNICILLTVQLAFVYGSDLNCTTTKCPPIPKHYEELGCEPIENEGDCCVKSFKCPELKDENPDRCFYKDEVIDNGERTNSTPTCSAGCVCAHGRIQCAHIDCAESFSYKKTKKNCIKQYDSDLCCSTGSICGDDIEKLETCTFEGETYREGQKMYPNEACYKCVCTKTFDNETLIEENENCQKIDCGISLRNIDRIREGCVPVYYQKENCCPIGWQCPGEKHLIEEVEPRNKNDTSPKCSFGKWQLSIGDSLDVAEEDSCQKCTCSIPPMIHCISTC